MMVDSGDKMSEATLTPEKTADQPTLMGETGVDVFADILAKHQDTNPLTEQVKVEGEALKGKAEEAGEELAEKVAEEAPKEEQPAKASDKDRERALAALRRAKAPKSMIDSLDDPETLSWGLELANQQADVDRLHSQNPKRAAELAGDQTEEPADAGRPSPDPMPKVEEFDFAAAVKPLEDHLDRDGTEALASFVQGAQAAMQKQVEAQAQALVQPLQHQLVELQVDLKLREMVGTFPQLADGEQRVAVRAKVGQLAASGAYGDEATLFGDACRLVLDDQSANEASSRTLELDRKRDGGTPTVPKAQTKPRASTPAEQHRSAFSEILKRHS